jgi:hypothetical protein
MQRVCATPSCAARVFAFLSSHDVLRFATCAIHTRCAQSMLRHEEAVCGCVAAGRREHVRALARSFLFTPVYILAGEPQTRTLTGGRSYAHEIAQSLPARDAYYIAHSAAKGWGVHSLRTIAKGTCVCTYTGELVRTAELQERQRSRYDPQQLNYAITVREISQVRAYACMYGRVQTLRWCAVQCTLRCEDERGRHRLR